MTPCVTRENHEPSIRPRSNPRLRACQMERAAPVFAKESFATATGQFVEALLDAAAVRAGTRVLDVACGSGVATAEAAARGAIATGLDFSPRHAGGRAGGASGGDVPAWRCRVAAVQTRRSTRWWRISACTTCRARRPRWPRRSACWVPAVGSRSASGRTRRRTPHGGCCWTRCAGTATPPRWMCRRREAASLGAADPRRARRRRVHLASGTDRAPGVAPPQRVGPGGGVAGRHCPDGGTDRRAVPRSAVRRRRRHRHERRGLARQRGSGAADRCGDRLWVEALSVVSTGEADETASVRPVCPGLVAAAARPGDWYRGLVPESSTGRLPTDLRQSYARGTCPTDIDTPLTRH